MSVSIMKKEKRVMIKERNKPYIMIFIGILLVFLINWYVGFERDNNLNKDCDYTVGKTIQYQFSDGFKDCIQYKFYVNDIKYSGCAIIDPVIRSPLSKYFIVKFSKTNPKINELDWNKEVTDSIQIRKAGFQDKK